MTIYTGYFAKVRKYEEAGLVPISIARWSPKWFQGERCVELSPSDGLLTYYKAGAVSEEDFEEQYIAELDNLDMLTLLAEIASDKDIVLCCYEKSSDFCHRHILAKYLQDKYGITVTEVEV